MANLSPYVNKGLSPDAFVSSMTRNQDKFKEWYDTFQWPSEAEKAALEQFAARANGVRCLIIAADWCGDVVRNVPVVFHLTEAAQIPTEVLIMEENLELIDQFLTFGGRSIPVVLFIDKDGEVVGRWGPRPAYVQEPMAEFKQANPDRNALDYDEKLKAARSEIGKRYGEGTGYQADIVKEIRAILERISG